MKRDEFLKVFALLSTTTILPSWAKDTRKKKLPNVLILGDSISIGYTPVVRYLLKNDAIVFRPMTSATTSANCLGTTNGIKNIERWIEGNNWDIIHFNFGLHDLKHIDPITKENSVKKEDPKEANIKTYKKNLKIIVEKLKNTKAKLIFATTTPFPKNPDGPYREPDEVEKYNKAALKIMKYNNILINDLHNYVLPKLKEIQLPINVHFSKAGYENIGHRVADVIRENL